MIKGSHPRVYTNAEAKKYYELVQFIDISLS